MKKFSCVLISGLVLLSLSTFTNVEANSWHAGTPSVFNTKNTIWISNYRKTKEAHYIKAKYERDATRLGNNYGINITPTYYNAKKQFKETGADESAGAAIRPHYMSLGHGYYKITSGSIKKKNSLKIELSGKLFYMFGSTWLVKVYNPKTIKVWCYKSYSGHGKRSYIGIMHRHAASDARKILKW